MSDVLPTDLVATEVEPGLLYYDYPQGSPEWKAAKLGVPSASMFATVMANGEGLTRSKYMRQLAGEIVSGREREDFKSKAMDRGTAMEPELRGLYKMISGHNPKPCGFYKRALKRGFVGASPDSLIDDDGLLEIKSMMPDNLIEVLQSDKIPSVHIPQIQGNLLVTGRKWAVIAVGYSGMPMFHKRLNRNSGEIARLHVGLETFLEELDDMVAWLRRYGKEEAKTP